MKAPGLLKEGETKHAGSDAYPGAILFFQSVTTHHEGSRLAQRIGACGDFWFKDGRNGTLTGLGESR
jgi:hypothetical protein